ncbi:MAG: SUMF1/EgtB/PvdO family nonheme iron enzyme [Nitrospinae bacterium]|nr:SUMF1/EgtB/PvdO family nonheme iron enzyme [Nitrospinota bacterium]MZH15520.1 SUMF1/EgtB/PvdO family nonheme iron enzyme [Nitrospinota bacterium]
MCFSFLSRNLLLRWSIFALVFFPFSVFASVQEETSKGDAAFKAGKMKKAEKYYSSALKMDPDSWRIMRGLAETKFQLKKYRETKELVDRILAMKIIKRNSVEVTLQDGQTFEAEIVDENVVPPDDGKNNMRNYVDGEEAKPILHYRLFNLKTGKMLLVPHSDAKLKYKGVPRRVYDYVHELHVKVEDILIGMSGKTGPVEMVEVKGGCFQMGSNKGAAAERPVHEVCLKAFQMDKYEVSQGLFQSTMGHNPARFKGADRPVERVTWHEADEFCRKNHKRLPTEAEWEYAARAGTTTEYYWGDEFEAGKSNLCDSTCDMNISAKNVSDGFSSTAPVGSFPANPWGLHDMTGNVYEWTSDWMDDKYYANSPKDNPKGPIRTNPSDRKGGGVRKVLRGGSWASDANSQRSAARKGFVVDYRIDLFGFRCVF